MNARQRFIAAGWLLFACLAVGALGLFAWSHFDARHAVTREGTTLCLGAAPAVPLRVTPERATGSGRTQILFATADPCSGTGHSVAEYWTTPNHVPGLTLVTLAAALGLAGVVLLRIDPTRPFGTAA